MKRVAIVGAGISGLAAAFYLERARGQGAEVEYVLFERDRRPGGVMRTDRVGGCLVEAGPDSFLTEKPWATTLCRDLGIEDQLIGSNDARRKTYIVTRGRLVTIPDGLQFMVPTRILPILTTPLFSLSSKLHMAREWFSKPRPDEGDESVAAFAERHYGREMVERMADPLLAGVYGGEASRLSVRAVLPRFLEMEKKHGSLSRGMLKARKHAERRHGPPRPLFSSLKDGMQQLVDVLLTRIEARALRSGAVLAALARRGERWLATPAGGPAEEFDAVIVATPAYGAAELLRETSPELAALLACIRYSSSVTVALGYEAAKLSEKERRVLDEGFGFLVPRAEGKRMLACTFVHNKFPHRCPEGWRLLRVFLGGANVENPEGSNVLQLKDEEILGTVAEELRGILGLGAEAAFARVYRWPRAMAQYEVGHLERVAEIERLRRRLPGLALAGNAYGGIGVPDCIRTGMDAVTSVTQALFPGGQQSVAARVI
ncbi:MAG TPA: protoporphyrinogen oxidase [Terriglobales bacterium]|nr:protoporphyrinogen oxidase [Terriglobales bacterium]